MFQALLKNSRIKYGKNFLEFFESPVQLLDKTRMIPFTHPAQKIDQVDNENKDIG